MLLCVCVCRIDWFCDGWFCMPSCLRHSAQPMLPNGLLDSSLPLILDEVNVWIGRPSEADCLRSHLWVSFSQLKSGWSQNLSSYEQGPPSSSPACESCPGRCLPVTIIFWLNSSITNPSLNIYTFNCFHFCDGPWLIVSPSSCVCPLCLGSLFPLLYPLAWFSFLVDDSLASYVFGRLLRGGILYEMRTKGRYSSPQSHLAGPSQTF